jgi:hypothetical protein
MASRARGRGEEPHALDGRTARRVAEAEERELLEEDLDLLRRFVEAGGIRRL